MNDVIEIVLLNLIQENKREEGERERKVCVLVQQTKMMMTMRRRLLQITNMKRKVIAHF
jgi:hypothetical protein